MALVARTVHAEVIQPDGLRVNGRLDEFNVRVQASNADRALPSWPP